jgi:ribosomal protein S18 acetylase RimI-like enzyme
VTGLTIEPLDSTHDRESFSCGVAALDRYLRQQAGQDMRRRVAVCYVAHPSDSSEIAGYYTLSAGSVALDEMPADMARRLPRYPVVPVARLGRLAIGRAHQGRHLGAALLWDAVGRASRAELGMVALVVDAKDEAAAAFYRHHGFLNLGSGHLQLLLPLATVAKLH